ncbi:HAMP domain-containing protein [Thermanaerosceptrum fracticalcis]|uniref:histidine kinase n=1 Tax=Thermanaerosceptrum fracticalcis TaxID=1712410 RepID=A0A7G6E7W0_THEFR|nr:ATP-binding protein [Thermanaerosceptrum fracticalcis]QNB48164.1 HAMP domain-containing protein [Thermanaerosceptrum fracticalcis]
MNSKIGVKLLTSYIVLVVITLVIVGSLLNPLFKNYLITAKKNELMYKANEIVTLTQKYNNKEMDEESFNRIVETLDRFIDTRFLIIDKEGRILAPSQVRPELGRKPPIRKDSRLSREEFEQVLSGQMVIKEGMLPHFNTPVISVALPVTTISSEGVPEVSGAVLSFSPVYLVTDTVKKAYYYLGISSVIAILLATGIAYYYSKKISLPLKNMNEAALAMAKGDYKTIIKPVSDDELGELATSMNFLASQLDSNITALEQEKGKLESIVLSINEGLIAADKEGRIILINPIIEKFFMTTAKRILGRLLTDISPLPELTKAFEAALVNGTSTSAAFKLLHSTFKVVVSPIKQENGNLLGAVGILQDISEMEKVEQLRRDFIANVSHELRAPVTVIRGYTDCLLDGVTDHPPNHYYSIIKNETLRLERLIKDLMDLSLLESGKVELHLEEVNLSELIYETVNKFQQRAKTKGIHLFTTVRPHQNIIVYCDADRIEQLLIILLDNAIKYTPSGGAVEVDLRDEKEKVFLSIKDTGIGIPEEDLPFIWERFYKVDKSRNRQNQNGTGLGLSIAKQIADLHHAEMTVESKLHEGSTFTLEIKKQN